MKIERGTIAIDGFCKTNVPGIYAIGDVAGPPMLAHKAEHEGVICVEAIKGMHPHPMDKRMIPGCTYCAPQVASVGPDRAGRQGARNSTSASAAFRSSATARRSRSARTRAWSRRSSTRRPASFSARIWSAPEVTELVQGFVVAMNLETTEEELMHTIFPHPTLSETMKEAVLDAYGRVLNM